MKDLLQLAGHPVRFAIRRIQKGDRIEMLPMIKEKGLFNQWRPIVKIYDSFLTLDYEKPGGLTEEECLEHINGCRQQLALIEKESNVKVEYIEDFEKFQ